MPRPQKNKKNKNSKYKAPLGVSSREIKQRLREYNSSDEEQPSHPQKFVAEEEEDIETEETVAHQQKKVKFSEQADNDVEDGGKFGFENPKQWQELFMDTHDDDLLKAKASGDIASSDSEAGADEEMSSDDNMDVESVEEEEEEDDEINNDDGPNRYAEELMKVLQQEITQGKKPSFVLGKAKGRAGEKADEIKLNKKKVRDLKKAKLQKKLLLEKDHVVPETIVGEFEVKLRRIGTRGVVELFNAIAQHRNDMRRGLPEPKKSSFGKARVDKVEQSKQNFLEILKKRASNMKDTK